MSASVFGVRGKLLWCVFASSLAATAASTAARADIYRWTDKDGNVNYSDVAPPKEQRIKDVVVVTKSTPAPTPSQQDLLARIQNLEQQLQAQQYSAPPQGIPQPVAAYYAPPMPAPQPYIQAPPAQPVTYYDAGYNTGYDNSLSYAPYVSAVPVIVVSTIRTRGPRPGFGHRTPGRGPFRGVPPGGRAVARR